MELKYKDFKFTKILGWSSSRYELFSKCKRQYYYNYYGRFSKEIPNYKIAQLKSLTSIPLEIGNIVHDIIEVLLYRLQKDDSSIDKEKFKLYAHKKTEEYVNNKSFFEVYYGNIEDINTEHIYKKVEARLNLFLDSPIFQWIFMNAMLNKTNWMIEPGGYGETRINGLKAYCKMDFLFPIEQDVHILDWKTGKRDEYKHRKQLIAYAAAANSNFNIPWEKIFPKIIYINDEYSEFEFKITKEMLDNFFISVKNESEEMKTYCTVSENNIPKSIDNFPKTTTDTICRFCNYRELCKK